MFHNNCIRNRGIICFGMILYLEGDEDLLEKLPSSKRDRGIQDDGRDAYDETPTEYLHKIAVSCGAEV